MKLLKRLNIALCGAIAGFLLFTQSAFSAVGINNMRFGNQTDGMRIVFDMDNTINYRVFLLDSPKRMVVDLDNADSERLMTKVSNKFISKVRLGKMYDDDKRVVFELAQPVTVKKAFIIPAAEGTKNWRLVVDLQTSSENDFAAKIGNKYMFSNNKDFSPKEAVVDSAEKIVASTPAPAPAPAPKPEDKTMAKINRKRIVVLDPGHGGKDPGAIGAYGRTYEKNVTLAMGKEMKQILQKKGYIVYLTRENDVFIPLRQRIKIAQKYKADLFMSLHADSAQNRNATGLSVYTLSDVASDKEAAALAERENKADIIGGVDLGNNSKEVNDILISLSQTDTRNKSSKYATYLVREMSKNIKLVKNTHRFAGFAVLKAPDIPSALLEMGYLSNRTEEANLKKSDYRRKLAEAAARAIDLYFKDPEIASN